MKTIEHLLNLKLQPSLAKKVSFLGDTDYGGFARCSTSRAACSEFCSSFFQNKYRTNFKECVASWSLTLVDGQKQPLIESPSVLVGFTVIRECTYEGYVICVSEHLVGFWPLQCLRLDTIQPDELAPRHKRKLTTSVTDSGNPSVLMWSCDSLTGFRRSDFLVT